MIEHDDEAFAILRAAYYASADAIEQQREALDTIATGLTALTGALIVRDRSPLHHLVACARMLGRLMSGHVHGTVDVDVTVISTSTAVQELLRMGIDVDPGGRAIFRAGCVELHIQLAPAASEESR